MFEVLGQAKRAEKSKPLQAVGRVGTVSYGIVHLLVAWLALQIVFGGSGGSADQKGAVATIAAQPFGIVLLWVLVISLVGFGCWQLLAAVVGFQWISDRRTRRRRRFGAAGRGVAVLVLAGFGIVLLSGGSDRSSNAEDQDVTAKLLSVPGGQLLVGFVALGVVVAAGFLGYRGYTRKFLTDLDTGKLPARFRRPLELLGMAGYLAKGVAYATIGVLLAIAALKSDPSRAGGLDKALHTLAGQPFGVVLLVAVALGFAAFGCYCFGDARCRRM